jgi:hypothetical protein
MGQSNGKMSFEEELKYFDECLINGLPGDKYKDIMSSFEKFDDKTKQFLSKNYFFDNDLEENLTIFDSHHSTVLINFNKHVYDNYKDIHDNSKFMYSFLFYILLTKNYTLYENITGEQIDSVHRVKIVEQFICLDGSVDIHYKKQFLNYLLSNKKHYQSLFSNTEVINKTIYSPIGNILLDSLFDINNNDYFEVFKSNVNNAMTNNDKELLGILKDYLECKKLKPYDMYNIKTNNLIDSESPIDTYFKNLDEVVKNRNFILLSKIQAYFTITKNNVYDVSINVLHKKLISKNDCVVLNRIKSSYRFKNYFRGAYSQVYSLPKRSMEDIYDAIKSETENDVCDILDVTPYLVSELLYVD